MPKITIYNDSDSDLDADFDVVELLGGKEATRKTMPPDDSGPETFRLYASNQVFMIVPRGTTVQQAMSKDGKQVDAKPKSIQATKREGTSNG